ncbi:MAG TPA: flagellar hook-length control protein FliK, partial [Burkholderiaceae bacterium]|nr:flagellar hook-length control protein FliK [Burkholderiaceae bacterium]
RREASGVQASPSASVRIDQPLLEAGQSAQLAAQRLRTGVEYSGLFFESHLGQWATGERGMQALRTELASIQRAWVSAGDDAAMTAVTKAGAHTDAQRVAAQLDVLQRASFLVQAQAWAGQPCTISFHEDINPDDRAHSLLGQRAPAVIGATLALDLPKLGVLQVQFKLVGHTVALSAQAEAASLAQIQSGIGQLSEALQARGLTPAAISVRAVVEDVR